ncbi:hypothetical protein P3T76_014316 [Phytophthora citrophthora]|uniref:Uncharacterized protein n=1 Tax=Phytophthora citrophthora TaxID=4793 RepID=A0AAD9LC36_9STRA|nr:hypothetical protein P3T76_014316 [Phytophthora citrophthora]
MRDLRARVATLNQQLTTIAAQRASPASSNAELSEINPRAKTVELIRQTQRLQVQLEAERSLLRKLLGDSYLHMTKLRDILNAKHQLYLAHSSFFLVLKPLTPSDCQRKLEEAQTQVNNFSTVAGSLDLLE